LETRNVILDEKNDDFVKLLGNFYSIKAEVKYSFHQYNDFFDGWEELQASSGYGLGEEFSNYMRFRSNYFSCEKYDHYAAMFHFEGNASIVDRYILFVRVCQHLVSEIILVMIF
jgi:hypothetical protein